MVLRALRALFRLFLVKRNPVSFFRSLGAHIGDDCRIISPDPGMFGSEPYLIWLGDHVTLSAGVRLVTHDGGVWIFRREEPDINVLGPIRIEDNVFVGIGAILMPGVTVGPNSVVGAGAVVTRDVEAGTIVGGVPARKISTIEKYRDRTSKKAVRLGGLDGAERRRRIELLFPKP